MSDMALGQTGVLQVIPPDVLEQQLAERDRQKAQANQAGAPAQNPQQLAGYIKGQWEIFRNHRNTSAGWSERLLICLRTAKTPTKRTLEMLQFYFTGLASEAELQEHIDTLHRHDGD